MCFADKTKCDDTFALFTSKSSMGFKERIKKICRVKYVIVFCLILLCIWWGSDAMFRYWSQPLSTDISYKYGENEKGIQFPLITLCNMNILKENKMLKDCYDGSWSFMSTLISCAKRKKTLKKTDDTPNFHPELKSLVEMVQLWTGSEYVNLHQYYETVWSKVFHNMYGPCYTFDLSKVDKFKYIHLKAGLKPGIEFVMAEKFQWTTVVLMLHTRFDLPDAYELNGVTILPFSDEIKQVHKVECRKKISKKASTRKTPCVKHEYGTCQNIEANRVIFERFHCRIPIIYSGHHLDDLKLKEAPNCSYAVTLKALDFILSKESNCSPAQTCENVRFTSKYLVEETWLENKTLVYIRYENPEVEYHHSYINYDLISLIGEIGGILGITIGASALTLFEFLFKRFPFY